MLVLSQWWIIELSSQPESEFRCAYPLSCIKSWDSFNHSENDWAGITGV